MCDGPQGAYAIAVTGRGGRSFIEPFSGGRYNCEYCGNCITACPVGAVMSRLHRHVYRPWFVEKETRTVCGFCGVGCSMVLQMRENSIIRAVPKTGVGINSGLLCAKGRFGYDFVENQKRLTAPLIKKNGELKPASWDEAFSLVANKLGDIVNNKGGKAIAGIASPRCSNEDNYVFQRFFRETLESNNIDSISRLSYAPVQKYLEGLFGQGITANLLNGIGKSDAVIVMGGDPTKINPVLGLQVRTAYRNGAKIVPLCNAEGLTRFSSGGPVAKTGKENLLYASLLKACMDTRGLPGSNKALEEKLTALQWPGEEMVKETGLDVPDIIAAANELMEAKNVSLIIGPEITAVGGLKGLFLIASLGYVLDARFYILSERPNEQGVVDMGCLPDMLAGCRPLGISSFREKAERELGYRIPSEEGLTLLEMFEAMEKGDIRACYIMGDNPVFNVPGAHKVQEILSKLDFLVVQDIFLSETARMADVVFPAAAWAEKSGTYVNLERRIQKLNKAKNSLGGMEDWLILTKLSRLMGAGMNYGNAADVWEEICRASHLYGPLTYEDLKTDQGLWPYKGEPLRGVESEITMPEDDGFTPDMYPVLTEKNLFHSGTLSRYSPALKSIRSEPFALMGADVADGLGITHGDKIKITAGKRSLVLVCGVDISIKDSTIRVTNVFEGVNVMSFLDYTIEPTTKTSVLNPLEIKVEKVS